MQIPYFASQGKYKNEEVGAAKRSIFMQQTKQAKNQFVLQKSHFLLYNVPSQYKSIVVPAYHE